ncbi:hypothetical protein KHQ06_18325 [Nocardia tengchongensis]|uniref:Uncharacterized protein n=1 Tax=Nocardia tengchongensis TaxID=2055889 RepID=A0ABX8CZ20_9NOCA|nr:hypothetical protein [Nocardia tengchongensis]QVI24503.1 hypothetical protein KHQ06_18325 [Nocardia tengchongensis]
MIEEDDQDGGVQDGPPGCADERAEDGRGGGEGQAQAVGVEGDVALLVGQDEGGRAGGEGVTGAVTQGPVVGNGDDLGDGQHHEFQAQAQPPAQPDEDRVGPMTGDRFLPCGVQEVQQQARVVALLGDEQPHCRRVDRIARRVGLGDEMGTVARLTHLEALNAAHEVRMQGRPAGIVGIARSGPCPRLRLEFRGPPGEFSRVAHTSLPISTTGPFPNRL